MGHTMDARDHRHDRTGRVRPVTTGTPAGGLHPERPQPAQRNVLQLQRTAGNAAVAQLLRSGQPVQRLVDRDEALKRVTESEFKDLKARLDAGGGTGMANLETGHFIRLASLFRRNRDSLNLLKSASLEHLAFCPYETQDAFAATKLHPEVEGFPVARQQMLIDNAVLTADLSVAIGELSVQSKKHIAVPKHKWVNVVAAPHTFQPSDERADAVLHQPSWDQVADVMYQVVAYGKQTLYKATTYQRIHTVNGQEVAVIFALVGTKPRVSDGWVV